MSRRLLPLLLVLSAASCGGESTAPAGPVAASLEIFPGSNFGGMTPGGRLRVPIVLLDTKGDTMPMPPGLSFVSRNPAAVSVDSGTWITSRSPLSGAWLVASLDYHGKTFADSLQVAVVCTAELRETWNVTGFSITMSVGEVFSPTLVLSSCGGHLILSDTFTWSAFTPGVISVDATTGRTTAIAPGSTGLVATGPRYGMHVLEVKVR
jgi:hypothetical protein